MRTHIAGLPFEVTPSTELSADERASLARIDAASPTVVPNGIPFVLEVCTDRQHPGRSEAPPPGSPARIEASGDQISLHHSAFCADLNPLHCRGVLRRETHLAYPLEITLRTALCSRLPLLGGVALHAAGLVLDGMGMVFFGPSGAGKTTIASLAPFPALSDELVALYPRPWRVTATGFWGEIGASAAGRSTAPLAGLCSLEKGPALEFIPLEPMAAVRRLVEVVVLPPVPSLWGLALAALGRLVLEVPIWSMAWAPHTMHWVALNRILNVQSNEKWRTVRAEGEAFGGA